MHAPLTTTVTTDDADRARALLSDAYAETRLRIGGSWENFRFAQTRTDLGQVCLDSVTYSMDLAYSVEPLGRLVIARVLDGRLAVRSDGAERRHGPGEVFLNAQPHHGFDIDQHALRTQVVALDLSLLNSITDEPATELVSKFAVGALPLRQAQQWQRTVRYARATVADETGASSPLLRGQIGRLLAASAITAFAPQPGTGSPRDRADATSATVRRATAFIETNPDLDIGVADIARACHLSVRAVQLAFRQHLDTTPMAYLRRVRLDQAHAELIEANPGSATVTRVAARWGFHGPSAFAVRYRAAYGEPPGETLRRG